MTYVQALRDAHAQLLSSDPRVFLIGQGLWSPWYAGASLKDIEKEFGRARVIDSPVAENAVTAAAVGAALVGMRPIVFHPRMDFMLLAADPIINQAANWSYLFAGQISVPIVIRATINRGGEQGAQHSQALHAMFAHVPGLKVVMPFTPADAKGLLIAAVQDGNPVLFVDDRWLYESVGDVPTGIHPERIGQAQMLRHGADITIVASSYMCRVALDAAAALGRHGVSAEVIDLRSIKPWDKTLVFESVRRTGRLLVADSGWRSFGVAAEIVATVLEECFCEMRTAPVRVCLPDAPAPTSATLEQAYYLGPSAIEAAALQAVSSAAATLV